MLVSIPRKLFETVINSKGDLLVTFYKRKDGTLRKKPYQVELFKYVLNNGKKVKVVFGQAANKPFDTIYDKQKNKIGKFIN